VIAENQRLALENLQLKLSTADLTQLPGLVTPSDIYLPSPKPVPVLAN
jgi:hypothetical protein